MNTRHRSRMVLYWLDHPPPAPAETVTRYGESCPEQGCHKIMCGATPEEAAGRLAEHKRRCHG